MNSGKQPDVFMKSSLNEKSSVFTTQNADNTQLNGGFFSGVNQGSNQGTWNVNVLNNPNPNPNPGLTNKVIL